MIQTEPIGERIGKFIRDKSALPRLILINIIVWLAVNLLMVFASLFQTAGNPVEQSWLTGMQYWLAVPAGFDLWISRPWTIITYMFLHLGFWHLFFNMLWLYWFGKIFLEFKNSRHLLGIYLFGGILGAITFMLAFNIFPAFAGSLNYAVALGASASVLAIVAATAILVPDYSVNLIFIGPVKIKYIALFMLVLDVFMLRSGNAGGHFAHLGGALAGLLYVVPEKLKIKFLTIRFKKMDWSIFRKRKVKKVYSSGRPLSDEDYNSRKASNQKKIDSILDKIAKSGYKSLTEEEKEFLFKFSNK